MADEHDHRQDGGGSSDRPKGLLHGVLVTYRRPREVAETLARLAEQDRRLDRIVVVDNASLAETEAAARDAQARGSRIEYLPMPENLGFAGGVGAGMEHVFGDAGDGDWIVVLYDDDPPRSSRTIAELERFANRMAATDPRTAAVGIHGGRFDWRRGRLVRVADDELEGPVALDFVAGNSLPFFRVGPLREVGPFSRAIFFGLSEVEHGLRLRRAGYMVYADGDLWRRSRREVGRMGVEMRPSRSLPTAGWRRYYSLRNVIYLLRHQGHRGTALRVTLVQGIGKPLANVLRSPARAAEHLRLNARACRDGWTDRMGRTLEPEPWGRRPTKAVVRS